MKKVIKFFDWWFASGVSFGMALTYLQLGYVKHPFIAGIVLSAVIGLAIHNSYEKKLEKQNVV
jgi:hypothetical protein